MIQVNLLRINEPIDLLHAHIPKNRKLFLYSAHDTTLIPCLMALGVFDMEWPPYAADITLELHQHRQTKEACVKVSYLGQVGPQWLCSWSVFFPPPLPFANAQLFLCICV